MPGTSQRSELNLSAPFVTEPVIAAKTGFDHVIGQPFVTAICPDTFEAPQFAAILVIGRIIAAAHFERCRAQPCRQFGAGTAGECAFGVAFAVKFGRIVTAHPDFALADDDRITVDDTARCAALSAANREVCALLLPIAAAGVQAHHPPSCSQNDSEPEDRFEAAKHDALYCRSDPLAKPRLLPLRGMVIDVTKRETSIRGEIMVGSEVRRARSMEEFAALQARLAPAPDEPTDYKPYEPKASDVIITSWAKSGTTLMQQMFHQLRTAGTGGDMDFDDISRVLPWQDTAEMLGFDMTTPQPAQPRGFKSHRHYEGLPSGLRYVVTLRDPKDTFVSFYRFMNGWHLEDGAVGMAEFLPVWMSGGPGGVDYFTHLLSWWARRDEADTLLTTYRAVVKDRPTMIRRLAAFCDLPADDAIVALVDERTSREFMVEYKDRFDDAMVCAIMESRVNIPAASDSSKVQASGSDQKTLPDSVVAQIDAMWAERVTPVTGHANFAELEAELAG